MKINSVRIDSRSYHYTALNVRVDRFGVNYIGHFICIDIDCNKGFIRVVIVVQYFTLSIFPATYDLWASTVLLRPLLN